MKQPSIVFIGDPAYTSHEAELEREFRRRGWDTLIWNNKKRAWWLGRRSWWHLSRGEKFIYDSIRSVQLYTELGDRHIDVLFVPKAENIHSHAIKRLLEKTRAKLVVWNPDNPFKDDMSSMNILRSFKRCTLYYIWGKFLIEPLLSAGCRKVEHLPFCFDPSLHPEVADITAAEKEKFAADITFIGTWDHERARHLEPLADFDLAIWGPGWDNLPASSPLRRCVRGGGIFGRDMVAAYKSSKIVFNHLRDHNGSSHNVRTLEITGIGGGVLLVRRTLEQSSDLFDEERHLLAYSSIEEMRERCQWAIGNTHLCKAMAKAAQQRVFERHLISHRVDRMLEDFQQCGIAA